MAEISICGLCRIVYPWGGGDDGNQRVILYNVEYSNLRMNSLLVHPRSNQSSISSIYSFHCGPAVWHLSHSSSSGQGKNRTQPTITQPTSFNSSIFFFSSSSWLQCFLVSLSISSLFYGIGFNLCTSQGYRRRATMQSQPGETQGHTQVQ